VGLVVLSHYQGRSLLKAWKDHEREATTSLDLGLTRRTVSLSDSGVTLPDGQTLPWPAVHGICEAENSCFVWRQGRLAKIQAFSEALNRVYTLYPTEGAPTMLISGIPMHRIKGVDPHRDTLSKMKAIAPIGGTVLDTATGLGYTAIEAARSASQVTTIELDPTVLEICRDNPWSQALFTGSNIDQRIGDAFDLVQELPAGHYTCVIHDPPTFSLAGHLYSAEFYGQLHRVLKPRGRLFHYLGDPDSRSGRNVTRGAVQRLKEAGFRRVSARPQAFGVVAFP
jgi:predicted methyltransferase